MTSVSVEEGFSDSVTASALKMAVTTLMHPNEYAKTLIQIGHEPIAPVQSRTFFGKPVLAYPSIFKYIGVIKRRDGVLGLYAGFVPRVCGFGVNHLATEKFNQYWPVKEENYILGSNKVSDEVNHARLIEEIKRGAALRLTCVLATQPFTVMSVRAMAQFVGRETKYDSMFSAIAEIFHENGILGFWQGWIPRAIGEVSFVALASTITFLINKYILSEKDVQHFTSHVSSFIASSIVYPFNVVGNCVIVSRSGLAAGYPPCMPLYQSWIDCYRHLSSQKQLKRGSSMLFRYYTGPQVIVGDRVLPMNRSVLNMN